MELNRLSATEIVADIASGRTTSVAVVESCLDRILIREEEIHAWAFIDPELALKQARERDLGPILGPLHGLPVGIKDIIDTADMPTAMGSSIYADHHSLGDAACVAIIRNAGAIILGKTMTTEFASMSPCPTLNPHDGAHTPGGSSSGSAAAVADFMVPIALGTQTGGSVLRPSSYCGIIGYKPSFGTFNLTGVKPAAQSLDTLGLHARSLQDINLVASTLSGRAQSTIDLSTGIQKIGICRTPLWQAAQEETVAALEYASSCLAKLGCEMIDVELPDVFNALDASRAIITAYERSHALTWEWTYHRDQIGDPLCEEIIRGRALSHEDYARATRHAKHCRRIIEDCIKPFDVFLAPTADGAAPLGIASTGNARFQGFWTILRLPSITLPTHTAPNGLPVGIQIVGKHAADIELISAAQWIFDNLISK